MGSEVYWSASSLLVNHFLLSFLNRYFRAYTQVSAQNEGRTLPVMSAQEFADILPQHDIPPADLPTVLAALEAHGFVKQLTNSSGEVDRVLIDPVTWLTRVLAEFLHPTQALAVTRSKDALPGLTVRDIASICAEAMLLTEDQALQLVDIMAQLDVCFQVAVDDAELVQRRDAELALAQAQAALDEARVALASVAADAAPDTEQALHAASTAYAMAKQRHDDTAVRYVFPSLLPTIYSARDTVLAFQGELRVSKIVGRRVQVAAPGDMLPPTLPLQLMRWLQGCCEGVSLLRRDHMIVRWLNTQVLLRFGTTATGIRSSSGHTIAGVDVVVSAVNARRAAIVLDRVMLQLALVLSASESLSADRLRQLALGPGGRKLAAVGDRVARDELLGLIVWGPLDVQLSARVQSVAQRGWHNNQEREVEDLNRAWRLTLPAEVKGAYNTIETKDLQSLVATSYRRKCMILTDPFWVVEHLVGGDEQPLRDLFGLSQLCVAAVSSASSDGGDATTPAPAYSDGDAVLSPPPAYAPPPTHALPFEAFGEPSVASPDARTSAVVFDGRFGDVDVKIKRIGREHPQFATAVEQSSQLVRLRDVNIVEVKFRHLLDPLDFLYLVLDNCHTNLETALERREINASVVGRDVCRQMVLGLQYLHGGVAADEHEAAAATGGIIQHLVHGNLKPANVLLQFRQSGNVCVKLADIGGLGTGHDAWQAPEVLDGAAASLQTDVFSLGCLFYYVLAAQYDDATGQLQPSNHPFGRDTNRITAGDCTVDRAIVGYDAQHLITLMLAPTPADRLPVSRVLQHPVFASAMELLKRIEHVSDDLQGEMGRFPTVSGSEKTRIRHLVEQLENVSVFVFFVCWLVDLFVCGQEMR